MLDEHFDFVMGNVGPEMRYRGPENKFNASLALQRGNPDLALISRLQIPSMEVMKGQGSAWVLLYQDELAQVWGRASRYGDPARSDFIPPARRQIGEAKQGGFAAWPAIPGRHQPDAPTKENILASHVLP